MFHPGFVEMPLRKEKKKRNSYVLEVIVWLVRLKGYVNPGTRLTGAFALGVLRTRVTGKERCRREGTHVVAFEVLRGWGWRRVK